MRAAIFQGSKRPLSIEQIADPIPSAADVVLAVHRAGICGSDLHLAEYDFVGPGTVFGHEFSGEIVALGAQAPAGLKIGDRVTANPFDACRTCDVCGEGHTGLCTAGKCIGVAPDMPGAYAEYVSVPGANVQRLPTGVSFEEGALVEPMSVAYHAVLLAQLSGDDDVLVLGAGPIGIAVTLLCKLAGARRVIVSEPAEIRRDQAKAVGATATIDPRSGPLADQCRALLGRAPGVVIECAGSVGRIQDAIEAVDRRGLVVIPGACLGEDRFIPTMALMKQVRLQFSMTYTDREFGSVIDLIARGELDPTPLHTDTVSLRELPDTFAALSRNPHQVKVLIDPARN